VQILQSKIQNLPAGWQAGLKSKIGLSLALVLFISSAAFAGVSRAPYLQPADDLSTAVVIAWQTDNKSGGSVRFGVKDVGESSAEGVYDGRSPLGKHRWHTLVKGLKPGTTYQYKVVSDGTETKPSTFLTSSTADDFQFRVLLIADTHAHPRLKGEPWCDDFARALPDFLAFKPNLVLHLGDVAHPSADPGAYEALFRLGRDLWSQAILLPTAGNHDAGGPAGAEFAAFLEEFYSCENGPDGGNPANRQYRKLFYSVDFGGVRFVSLGAGYLSVSDLRDGIRTLDAELDKAVADGRVRNIVAMKHVGELQTVFAECLVKELLPGNDLVAPPRKSPAAAALWGLFDRHRVAAYFSGHVHFYLRGLPVKGGEFTTDEREDYTKGQEGTIASVIPSTCALGPAVPPVPKVVSERVLGWAEMIVSKGGRRIEVTAYAKDPQMSGPRRVIDHYVIERDVSK
jgi:hypothetical protein